MPFSGEPLLLIPARGGSKGIPRKNIYPIAGKPLIGWTIEAAAGSRVAKRVILSTDDPEIQAIALEFGAEAPFLRPDVLASDTASSVEVAEHALCWLGEKEQWHPEWIILLQPTSPLRQSGDISCAFRVAKDFGADAVIGVTEPSVHPYLARTITADGKLTWLISDAQKAKRRQDYPEAWMINGAIYIVRTEVLLRQRTFQPENTLPFVMPPERSIDIDSLYDLKMAQFLLQNAASDKDFS